MFIYVMECRSSFSVRITFRRQHERIALWDHHTALWARLRAVLTKSADEWTGKFEKLQNFKRSRNFSAGNRTKAILVQNCHAAVSVGFKPKETQEEC